MTPPSIVFGFGLFGKGGKISSLTEAQKFLDILKANKIDSIDTAGMYENGGSEEFLGLLGASKEFKISTKVFATPSSPGAVGVNLKDLKSYTHSAKDIHRAIEDSFKALQTDKVDVYYLHAPDRDTPFEETLAAIDKEYKAGRFERFGISNFSVEDVQKVLELCEQNSWIKPSVYQGMYNGIHRTPEDELLSLLRKSDISFYAYSATAGGFFAVKEEEEVESGKRYDPNGGPASAFYRGLYWYEKNFEALRLLRPVAEKHNVGMISFALRWCYYHSSLSGDHGDAIVLGTSSISQLEQNLADIKKGPLAKELVDAMEAAGQLLKKA